MCKPFLVLQEPTPAAPGLTYHLRWFVRAPALGSTLEAGLAVEQMASSAEMMLDAARAKMEEAAPRLQGSVRSTCCRSVPTAALYAAACPMSELIASSCMKKAAGIQIRQDPT